MRYFFCSLIVAGLLLAGCSGSKDTVDSEPATEEEQAAEDEQAAEEMEPAIEAEPVAVVESPIVGDWEGSLSLADGSALRVIVHITQDADGNPAATLDSPDQGALGIPVDEVRFEDRALYLYLQVIEGSYTGALQEDNETIEGTWTQPAGSMTLNMERVVD